MRAAHQRQSALPDTDDDPERPRVPRSAPRRLDFLRVLSLHFVAQSPHPQPPKVQLPPLGLPFGIHQWTESGTSIRCGFLWRCECFRWQAVRYQGLPSEAWFFRHHFCQQSQSARLVRPRGKRFQESCPGRIPSSGRKL